MNNRVFAQLMANLCMPKFAELVLEVPERHASDNQLQHQVITSISHGNQMARICQGQEAWDMIYATTVHLFNEATPQLATIQVEAHRQIVSMVAHAHGMARIAMAGAEEIYSTVRPMATEPLPQAAKQLRLLNDRLDAARQTISNVSHRVAMERIVTGMKQL